MPARILVGSCSWTDPTLIACGRFYPPRVTSAEARLRYYAEQFDIVEVDSTYYAPPSARNSELWAARTPARLRLQRQGLRPAHPPPRRASSACPTGCATRCRTRRAASGTSTPGTSPRRPWSSVWELHREALEPLAAAGKLGAVLFQFPPWFVRSRDNRAYLRDLPARLPGWPLAVEFRGGGWMDDESAAGTLRLLEEAGLAYVGVDEPQGFPNSTPPLTAVDGAAGGRPAARPQRRHVGEPDRRGVRPLQVPLQRRRARGVGPARPRARRADAVGARPLQQQLRGLGHAERAPHGAPARGGACSRRRRSSSSS